MLGEVSREGGKRRSTYHPNTSSDGAERTQYDLEREYEQNLFVCHSFHITSLRWCSTKVNFSIPPYSLPHPTLSLLASYLELRTSFVSLPVKIAMACTHFVLRNIAPCECYLAILFILSRSPLISLPLHTLSKICLTVKG